MNGIRVFKVSLCVWLSSMHREWCNGKVFTPHSCTYRNMGKVYYKYQEKETINIWPRRDIWYMEGELINFWMIYWENPNNMIMASQHSYTSNNIHGSFLNKLNYLISCSNSVNNHMSVMTSESTLLLAWKPDQSLRQARPPYYITTL